MVHSTHFYEWLSQYQGTKQSSGASTQLRHDQSHQSLSMNHLFFLLSSIPVNDHFFLYQSISDANISINKNVLTKSIMIWGFFFIIHVSFNHIYACVCVYNFQKYNNSRIFLVMGYIDIRNNFIKKKVSHWWKLISGWPRIRHALIPLGYWCTFSHHMTKEIAQ